MYTSTSPGSEFLRDPPGNLHFTCLLGSPTIDRSLLTTPYLADGNLKDKSPMNDVTRKLET